MLTIKGPIRYGPKQTTEQPEEKAVEAPLTVLVQARDEMLRELRALEGQLRGVERAIELLGGTYQ